MMQLGVIILGEAEGGGSSDAAPATAPPPLEESGDGGNRWPRQETLALLKIRSDMDVTFKDASLKGPLWEEVSRKMGELGFQRSAKKCKEKFENVYKYHKRTKDSRASKPDGKNYRFFDQLAALETTPLSHSFSPPPPPPLTVSSTTSPTPLSVAPPTTRINSLPPFQPPPLPPQHLHHQPVSTSPVSNSTSSSTSSDEDIQRRRGRKRKWKDYFERLMKDVVEKQEELQKKFLETLEKREGDRIAREEAWRVQEMARLNREHDRLVQERSAAAAKDAAVIAFLQKVTGEQHSINLHNPASNTSPQPPPMQVVQQLEISQPTPPPPQQTTLPPTPTPTPTSQPMIPPSPKPTELVVSNRDNGGGGDDHIAATSSRWPKAEVEALIKLRTGLELKYQDNGPKGPLWEEISKSMAKLGYNRNSKRCKEKWENINKYFKKVKESSKKRPEDSKTCPYFHQLDAIYKERAKSHVAASLYSMKPEAPIMARPEQQWPQPEQQNPALHENDSTEKNEEDDDYEDDDDVGEYEIITNKQPSSVLTNTVD